MSYRPAHLMRGLFILVAAAGLALTAGCGGGGALPATERQDIDAATLQAMMNDGQPLLIINVDPPITYAQRHIPGSVNLPSTEIDTWAPTLNKLKRICCVCA